MARAFSVTDQMPILMWMLPVIKNNGLILNLIIANKFDFVSINVALITTRNISKYVDKATSAIHSWMDMRS